MASATNWIGRMSDRLLGLVAPKMTVEAGGCFAPPIRCCVIMGARAVRGWRRGPSGLCGCVLDGAAC